MQFKITNGWKKYYKANIYLRMDENTMLMDGNKNTTCKTYRITGNTKVQRKFRLKNDYIKKKKSQLITLHLKKNY